MTQGSSDQVSLCMGNVGGQQQEEEVVSGNSRGSTVAHSSSYRGNLLGVAPVRYGAIYIYWYVYKNL